MTVGQRLTVRVEDVAFGGDGVGRFEQFVVFVPFVVAGELLEVEVTEVKRNFARARLLNVIEPSPQRVTAPCPYFGACGGCQYQHVAYAAQLELKHKQITDIFVRIGKFPAALIAPVMPCPQPYGYRNRVMIRSQWDKFKQGLNIGFLRHDNPLVVDIEACKISEPAINEQIRHVRAHPPPKGGIKVVLRIAAEGWQVPQDSFFQNNFFLLSTLVETVRAMVTASGARLLVDAYCGVGFFALELADLVDRFVGIELDKHAIKAARANAAAKQRTNGDFIIGTTEEQLPRVLEKASLRPASIVLDPPRTGCRPEVLELLRRTRPSQVIYVSCHPATLARDLNILCSGNVFELKQVRPLDMFPQTQHVECVAELRPRERE
ncbi:MAG TPA: TRAM domain-containing protein [Verrucomicrobiae bacterium]|nr:TRAM domain-containing protein [Verrucomicrobiae bacterium]